jgi:hypothetical protein
MMIVPKRRFVFLRDLAGHGGFAPTRATVFLAFALTIGATGCGGSSDAGGGGGTVGASGGSSATGGQPSASGGANASGGTTGSGGTASSGGAKGSGGATGSGGAGMSGTGGTASSGGTVGTGGAAGANGEAGSNGAAGAGAGGAANGSGGAAGMPGSGGGAGGRTGAGGAAGPGTGGSNTGGPGYPYVFSVFNDSAAKSDLIIYTSNDALNFTLLYDTGYTGPTGFLRDPSIMKNTDGKFYVAFTTPPTMACCGAESSFSIASSANLKDWTTVTTVPAGVAGVNNTWAPEWFKDADGSVYILVNVDTKTYRYKAMNTGMTMFSGPTFIGIGPGYIDTFIIQIAGTYHAFTKLEAQTYVEHATATSIDGPWTFVGTGDWAKWGNHKEAPCVIDVGGGTYRIFYDAGGAGHEMYSDTTDMFKTWTAPKTLPAVGQNISHGTVIKGN